MMHVGPTEDPTHMTWMGNTSSSRVFAGPWRDLFMSTHIHLIGTTMTSYTLDTTMTLYHALVVYLVCVCVCAKSVFDWLYKHSCFSICEKDMRGVRHVCPTVLNEATDKHGKCSLIHCMYLIPHSGNSLWAKLYLFFPCNTKDCNPAALFWFTQYFDSHNFWLSQ